VETAQLAQRIKEVAYLEGDFVLRSGKRSKYYLDKYLFETQPTLLRELAQRFARFVSDEVDRIAGAELGGIALATATALATDKPFIIVRNSKKAGYGTGKLLEGRLEPGERVLLVEDICTSGGQAVEACRALVESGATVTGIVVTIDREEGGRDTVESAGYRFDSLFTTSDLGVRIPK
jgi:orotate phosphoribosyltransferase